MSLEIHTDTHVDIFEESRYFFWIILNILFQWRYRRWRFRINKMSWTVKIVWICIIIKQNQIFRQKWNRDERLFRWIVDCCQIIGFVLNRSDYFSSNGSVPLRQSIKWRFMPKKSFGNISTRQLFGVLLVMQNCKQSQRMNLREHWSDFSKNKHLSIQLV